jgi:hypothetical protein
MELALQRKGIPVNHNTSLPGSVFRGLIHKETEYIRSYPKLRKVLLVTTFLAALVGFAGCKDKQTIGNNAGVEILVDGNKVGYGAWVDLDIADDGEFCTTDKVADAVATGKNIEVASDDGKITRNVNHITNRHFVATNISCFDLLPPTGIEPLDISRQSLVSGRQYTLLLNNTAYSATQSGDHLETDVRFCPMQNTGAVLLDGGDLAGFVNDTPNGMCGYKVSVSRFVQ